MSKLLIVDDEPAVCWGIERVAKSLNHTAVTCSSAESALEVLKTTSFDLIVLDVRLPRMDGLTAIEPIRELAADVPIILITAFGDLETAVAAVRSRVFDYIVKPFDVDKVRQSIVRALERPARNEPATTLPIAVEGFVGQTPVMQEAFNRIAMAAASDASVLLQGESGTGKELAARAIHKFSKQSDGPFVVVNVASLSESLAESELFGHVRGAFTGAERERIGLLQQADGGTLFLDEVADIPLPLQVKLLRAVEQDEVVPVGAGDAVSTKFRLVSATHRDLLQEVEAGRFRHDLYFRMSTFTLRLPPLRSRRDDIVPLAEYFLQSLAAEGERTNERLSEEARQELERRDWYGNVRELRNAIEHALIVARGGSISAEHFPSAAPQSVVSGENSCEDLDEQIRTLLRQWTEQITYDSEADGSVYEKLLELVEPPVLARVLEANGQQFAASARIMGLHRTTLSKKADQYGLNRE